MLTLAIALHGLVAVDAGAQGFDGHGTSPPPDGPSVADPVFGFGGAITGPPTFTAWGATATDPLVERFTDGNKVTDVPVIDDLFGVELGFGANLAGPLGIGVTAPVWLISDGQIAGGPALGDTTLWAPVRLVHTAGQKLGVVPFVLIPTGPEARFLGESGFGGGGLVSGAVNSGPLLASLDAGVDATAASGHAEWPGGLHARYAGDLGFKASNAFGFHLEVRSRFPISSTAPTLPTESLASFKVRPLDRLFVSGGFGTAITRGVGAAGSRVFLGITTAPGQDALTVDSPDAVLFKDVHVIDVRSFPLSGALVTSGTTTTTTDYEGYAVLPARVVNRSGLIYVDREGFEPVELEVDTELDWWEVKLVRKPVSVAVGVVGPEGALTVVDVQIEGPYDPGPPHIDAAGVYNWPLKAGAWTVRMSSPGLGTQERTIIIEQDRSDPIRVDAVLAALLSEATSVRVQVVDQRGRPVEDAVVALEDRDLGTTGTGGDVKIAGLGEGAATMVVRSERFGDDTSVELVILPGEQDVIATLDWLPGSVQVEVLDTTGLPVDATVSFKGPVSLPQRKLGDDGGELFVLRPGTWEVHVDAPGMGAQRRQLELSEEGGRLEVVDVVLLPEEEGGAILEVRVVDPSGAPLADVDVTLGSTRVGRTSGTGLVIVEDLHPGPREISVGGDKLVSVKDQIELVPGRQIHTIVVPWLPGVTDFEVVDSNGAPVDATVTLKGPVALSPVQVGADGEERLVVPPGEWVVEISSDDMEVQERTLVVEATDGERARIQVELAPPDEETGEVALVIVDSEGQKVESAVVSVDGIVVGEVVDGEIEVMEFPEGVIEIEVSAEGMATQVVEVQVDPAAEEAVVEVPMAYVEGALEVTVVGPDGQPTDATVTLRGPEHLAPQTTEDGEVILEARGGEWWVVVEAEGMKTQEVAVDLPDEGVLTAVEVKLEAMPEKERARVILVAETPDGEAVANAEVRVDGELVGKTSGSGTIEIVDFGDDEMVVEITPQSGYDAVEIPVDRPRQRQQGEEIVHNVVVAPSAQSVRVQIDTQDGSPAPARILINGALPPDAPIVAGVDGIVILDLEPGTYTITAINSDGSIATSEVVIADRPVNDPSIRGTVDDQELNLTLTPVYSVLTGNRIEPPEAVLFDTALHDIRNSVDPLIDDVFWWLLAHPGAALVEVGGHTDFVGGVAYNQQLSERRARAIEAALVRRGIPPERLTSRGYGMSRPVTTETDAESLQQNRRVEFTILKFSSGAH